MPSRKITTALFSLFVAVALGVIPATSAVTLNLSEAAIEIDNGSDAKLTMGYPVLVDAAKKNVKLLEKTVSTNTVTLKFEGGGQIEVAIGGGDIVLKISQVPVGIQMISSSMRVASSYGAGGKWDVGKGETSVPPMDKGQQNLFQGNTKSLALISPSGIRTSFLFPENTYQQLQDGRVWGLSYFPWKFWIPILPGIERYVISIGTGNLPTASITASAPVVTAPVPASSPAKPGDNPADTIVFKWKDDKRAVFMMSFDDSCPSHIKNVIPELEKRKMVGTFYINPGNGPYKNLQAAWEKAAQSPFVELANHTWTHVGAINLAQLEPEMEKCNEVILKARADRKQPRLISFGTPGGVPWKVTKEEFSAELTKCHLINRPSFYGPPFHQKSAAEMIAVVDLALRKGDMGHLDFHGVGGDWHITPMEWFTALLDKLEASRNQLWITDPISWHQYLTERKTAKVTVVKSESNSIRLLLSCEADPAFYDRPLSLATRVPAGWRACTVKQGEAKSTVAVVDGQVNYDALPGADEIVLQPSDSI